MQLKLEESQELVKKVWRIDLTGDFPYDHVVPGQFVHILVGDGATHILRRPISIAEVDSQAKRLTLVFRVVGAGTQWLADQRTGALLDVIGPQGHGFALDSSHRSLVVGGGIGIPPLYELAKRLRQQGEKIDIYLGFRDSAEVFWVERFAALGEVQLFTEDGLTGTKGFVTQGIKRGLENNPNHWGNVYACGPKGMLQAMQKLLSGLPVGGGFSTEERMACGVGACYGCMTSHGEDKPSKRVCADGPVFGWQEVLL